MERDSYLTMPNRRRTSQSARILLVDDREEERKLLSDLLRLHGYRLHIAIDGYDAVEKARYILPDLILMDIYMPGCDGIAACRQIKADPRTANIPVIFLTAAALPEERVTGLSEGAVDYITKPYHFEEVKLRITIHLARNGDEGRATPAPAAFGDHPVDSVEHRVFRAAQRLLLEDLAKTPELSTLARAVGTNTHNLNEAFRKFTGVTALRYLRETRMKEACCLLRNTNLDVQSVAIDLGYVSPANFSTAFRERFGMSPREFRDLPPDEVRSHDGCSGSNLECGSGNRTVCETMGFAGSHADIAEQPDDAEACDADHDAQLDAVFASSPDGLVAFDAGLCVKYASPAYLQMTGQKNAEIIGLGKRDLFTSLSAICVPTQSSGGVTEMWQALMDDATGQHHLRIELAGKVRRVLELTLRLTSAAAISQILYVRDVTYEAEMNKMKSDFVSHAAHELRAPMASVFGFSELLITREFDSETRKDLLQTIHAQSAGLIEIINELLDLARIESRRGNNFPVEALALDSIVDDVLKNMRIDQERWPVVVDLPADLKSVMADAPKLRQALTNVLGNAVKYSPDAGAITIRANSCTDSARGFVSITVSDQGIGMSSEQTARVCERFYRADGSGKIPGTGLGMSIAKEIIELLGGKIEITSALGKGTAVTLVLPASE